jgi:hypothetical protein
MNIPGSLIFCIVRVLCHNLLESNQIHWLVFVFVLSTMTYLQRVAASTKPTQGDVYKGTYMCKYVNTFESSTYASLNIWIIEDTDITFHSPPSFIINGRACGFRDGVKEFTLFQSPPSTLSSEYFDLFPGSKVAVLWCLPPSSRSRRSLECVGLYLHDSLPSCHGA